MGKASSAFLFVSRLILLLGSLIVESSRLEATSVVALIDRSNERIVVAADCRVNRDSGAVQGCKIIEEPGCVVAIAGLFAEPTAGFHLQQLVHDACQHPGDLRAKAEAFVRISREPFEKAMRTMREREPASFAQSIANKATEALFAGIHGGHIALIVRGLVADSTGKISVERHESTAPTYARIGYFLGLNGHIRAYVKAHPNWVSEGYVRQARRFVEMEIETHPDLVGPPISELEIDEGGQVHWLDKGACSPRK